MMLTRFWALLAAVSLLTLAACGSGGGERSLTDPAANSADQPEVQLPEQSLPGFPDANWERVHPAGVSVLDNKQPGSAAIMMQDPGATVNGSALEFDGDAGPTALWGIWRWGQFQGNYPIKLLLDFSIEAGGEFYVLRSNYDDNRWELVGPLPEDFANDGRTTYPPGNFISPMGYTYVAVLTVAGTDMTINELNLLSDDDLTAPQPPTGLAASDILPGSFMLGWDDVDDPTLDGYNVYSGPNASFAVDDPGVEQLNLFPVSASEYLATGRSPNTTYHIGVTAVDVVGNESGLSEVIDVTTANDDPPGMPTGLTVDILGSETVTLSWTSPGDPDIQGYNIYIGDTDNFDLADGTKQDGPLYPGTTGLRAGLAPSTQYYARVTAVDTFDSEGPPSDSIGFMTVDDAEPIPDFMVSPSHIEKGKICFFNPSATFDPDDDVETLTFEWDFDNDDVTDETTTGPDTVQWTFTALGPAEVTLTVSDSTNSVDKTEILTVNRSYERFNLGNSKGTAGSLLGVVSHAESGQVAIAFRDDNNVQKLRYYNGTSWTVITMPSDAFSAMALSPQGPVVMFVTISPDITWNVQRYTGTWTSIASRTITGLAEPITGNAYLAAADNGRISAALVYFNKPAFGDPSYRFRLWHEKADSTFSEHDLFGGTRTPAQLTEFGLARSDDTTYLLDNLGGSGALDLFTINDGGSSEQSAIQTLQGNMTATYLDIDPDNPTQLFWGTLTTTDRVYYGDNYGTANGGSQFVDAGASVTELAGVGLVGDNEADVYWLEALSNGHQSFKGYSTDSSTPHDIGSGVGFCSDASGAYHDSGSGSGVWIAVEESRDGQVVARYVQEGSIAETLEVHNPTANSTVFTKAAPVVFSDDSIYSLHLQGYPVALAGSIPADHSTTSTLYVGIDSYVLPLSSCLVGNAGEYMVAGSNIAGNLVVNTLQKGLTGATQTLVQEDVGFVNLEYSPVTGHVMLVYSNLAETELNYQVWDGANWGGENTLATPAGQIKRFDTAVRADGEFGVVYATDADKLWFHETTAESWGAATEIYDGALTLVTSFVGLDYNSANQAAVACIRDSAGIWLGTIPDGGAVSWEQADDLLGTAAYSLSVVHNSTGNPVLVYLRSSASFADADLFLNEKIGGNWMPLQSASVVKILGIPLGVTTDSLGNIFVSGADKSGTPKALCVVFYD